MLLPSTSTAPLSFASPLVLALLSALPLLGWLWWRDERRRAQRLAVLVDRGLWTQVTAGVSDGQRALRRASALCAYLALVVAAAGPQVPGKTELLPVRGLDVMFVLDVSKSMRARDVLPDRLERAKAEIGVFLDRLADHRVGLAAFAGTAFVQCPLTPDKEALRLFLRDLSPASIPQGGTDLAGGLEVALNAVRAEKAGLTEGQRDTGHIVVVVTDGEDHEGGLDPEKSRLKDELKAEGITLFLIGVGSTLGEPIPTLDKDGNVVGYLKDRAGQTVMSRMSPELLSQVATAVGGTFIDGTNAPDLGLRDVEAKVQQLEKRELEVRTHVEKLDVSWVPLALALLALVVSLAVPERRVGVGVKGGRP